jgi:Polypeptide deformylase.
VVREICKDEVFLAQKVELAPPVDLPVAEHFQIRFKTFTGWPVQIVQHEIDHCEGIII